MISMSSIHPDRELRELLAGKILVGKFGGGTEPVTVYSDWERPTNKLPDDFIVIYINGDLGGVGTDTNYVSGYLAVSLYCRLNDDGSIKGSRIEKIMNQFDRVIECAKTDNYFFKYDAERYMTPTTPNQTSGYSATTLNIKWHTTNNFNNK